MLGWDIDYDDDDDDDDDDEPARARKKISPLIREGLYKRQGGKCMYCGRKVAIADMHADHKTPFDRNGSDNEKNLQMLCGPCNTRKQRKTDGEFRRLYKSVGLLPARQANGKPPSKPIPLKKFEEVSKQLQATNARRRRQSSDDDDDDDDFGFF